MLLIFAIVIILIAVFYVIISRFGTSTSNDDAIDDTSTVNYIPKKFLTNNEYHRKKRDIKVHDICNKAGIKLITFYTKYSNEKEYVKSRIIKELGVSSNND